MSLLRLELTVKLTGVGGDPQCLHGGVGEGPAHTGPQRGRMTQPTLHLVSLGRTCSREMSGISVSVSSVHRVLVMITGVSGA